ncbi:MAG: hypothetical protein RR036_00025 [Oscillospiraceae bacterium]
MNTLIKPYRPNPKTVIIIIIVSLLIPLGLGIFILGKNLAINNDYPAQIYTLKDAMADGYLSGKGIKPVQDIKDIVKKSDCFIETANIQVQDSAVKVTVAKSFFGSIKNGETITINMSEDMQKTPLRFDNVDGALLLLSSDNSNFVLSDGYSDIFYIKNDKIYPANDVTDVYRKYIGQSKVKFTELVSSKK